VERIVNKPQTAQRFASHNSLAHDSAAHSYKSKRNNYMMRRIGDFADAPRSLVTFRGIFVAALLLLAFWAYILSAVF
jgi:hypothetical protein